MGWCWGVILILPRSTNDHIYEPGPRRYELYLQQTFNNS